MFVDGLEDPEEKRLMGCYAEDCVEKYSLSREEQDDFAKQSLIRAQTAMKRVGLREKSYPYRLDPALRKSMYRRMNNPE